MHILLVYSLIIFIKVFLSFKDQVKSDTLHEFPYLFVVHFLSPVQHFVNLWTAARQASVSFTISHLFKLISVVLMMPSNHLILCHPLLLLSLIFHSIRAFSKKSALHIRWQSTGVSALAWVLPMNIQISFRIHWFDLLTVQGTFKSLLQYHNSKASILQHPAFFIIQLSHSYMTTGKW